MEVGFTRFKYLDFYHEITIAVSGPFAMGKHATALHHWLTKGMKFHIFHFIPEEININETEMNWNGKKKNQDKNFQFYSISSHLEARQ